MQLGRKHLMSVENYVNLKEHLGKSLAVFSKPWNQKKLHSAVAVDFVGDISGPSVLMMYGPRINMTSGGVLVYGCMLGWRLFQAKSTG